MKYKPLLYAKALVSLLSKKRVDQEKISDKFLQYLSKNGDSKQSKEIIALAEKLILQQTGNKKVILETARKLDLKSFVQIVAKKGDIVEERINPELIAGIKVTINNESQFDNSLQKKLSAL